MPKIPPKSGPKGGKAKQPPARAALPSDQPFSDDLIMDVSDAVYRDRLGPRSVASVLAEPNGAAKIRARAVSYNTITRSYLTVLKAKGLLK